MSNGDEFQRRIDDRDQRLHDRIDIVERFIEERARIIDDLAHEIKIVKLEQGHLSKMIDTRLLVMEKSQEMCLVELRGLSTSISNMASDPGSSPAGRVLMSLITLSQNVVKEHTEDLKSAREWQDKTEGALALIRWIGVAGLITIIGLVVKAIKG